MFTRIERAFPGQIQARIWFTLSWRTKIPVPKHHHVYLEIDIRWKGDGSMDAQ